MRGTYFALYSLVNVVASVRGKFIFAVTMAHLFCLGVVCHMP